MQRLISLNIVGDNATEKTPDKGVAADADEGARLEQRPLPPRPPAELNHVLAGLTTPGVPVNKNKDASYFTVKTASQLDPMNTLAAFFDRTAEPTDDYSAAVQEVLQQIKALWVHGREYRLVIGRLLIRLHELLCKPGFGSFMQVVSDPPPTGLGIAYTTARDYMELARKADAGPYGFRNDDPAVTDDTENITVIDNAAQIADAVQTEKEKVAEAEAAERYSDVLRIDCRLAPSLHDKCKERIKLLGAQEVGTRIYQALFPEEFNEIQNS
jgi:hypothetical protein